MSEPTPGPWEARPCGRHRWAIWPEPQDAPPITTDVDWEPNARLIAAAPTMYAYIRDQADAGDRTAAAILESIHGRGEGAA